MKINGTGRLLEVVTCRGCGAKGLEDPAIDPSPGLCPVCFEDVVSAAFGFDLELTRPADEEVPLDQRLRAAGAPVLPGLEGL